MKSCTLFVLAAVLLVCALHQSEASIWGDLKNDAKDAGQDISNTAGKVASDTEGALSSPTMQKVDKVAKEVEPVASLVGTGISIGEMLNAKKPSKN